MYPQKEKPIGSSQPSASRSRSNCATKLTFDVLPFQGHRKRGSPIGSLHSLRTPHGRHFPSTDATIGDSFRAGVTAFIGATGLGRAAVAGLDGCRAISDLSALVFGAAFVSGGASIDGASCLIAAALKS